MIKTEKVNYKGLVHIHLYYENQSKFFLKIIYILNNYDCDIYITHPGISENVIELFKKANKYNKITIIKEENIGYDVYPFISIINNAELEKYDYILKIHTKNYRNYLFEHNNYKFFGYGWRDMLILSLIGSLNIFENNISRFMSSDDVGILCSKKLVINISKEPLDIMEEAYKCLEYFNLPILKDWQYCSGTMFLIKPSVLQKLKNLHLNKYFFQDDENKTGLSNTKAATIERLFGYFVEISNKKIIGVEYKTVNLRVFLYVLMHYLSIKYIIKKIFSLCNSPDKRHKIITILGFKIKIKRGIK